VRRGRRLAGPCSGALLGALVAGCATASTPEPEAEPEWRWTVSQEGDEEVQATATEVLSGGVRALEEGEYEQASESLWRLASWCESGSYGRRALLVLAATTLDPRNPGSDPDEAARLAARYLQLPRVLPEERIVAESLYLMALARGGSPPGEGAAGSGDGDEREPALRFSDCDAPGGGATVAGAEPLPELPITPAPVLIRRARGERDALRARVGELEGEIDDLQAELDRIRSILRQGVPDTVPPDTVPPDTLDLPPR